MSENGLPESPVIMEEQEIPAPMIVTEEVTNSAVEAFEPIKDEILGSTEKHEGATGFAEENNKAQIPIPPLPDLSQQPAETELSFQPYHTVDYFASQGIKFVPEEK